MRLLGAREIASGFGILTQTKPAPWLWTRVGGDAMDLALLKSSHLLRGRTDNRVAAATAAVAGYCRGRCALQHPADRGTDDANQYQAMPRAAKSMPRPPSRCRPPLQRSTRSGRLPESAALHGRFRLRRDHRRPASRWSLSAPAGITLELGRRDHRRTATNESPGTPRKGRHSTPRARCVSGPPRAGAAPKSSSMPCSTRQAASWARRSPASLPKPWAPRSAVTCAASSNWSSWARSSTPTTASSPDPIPRNRRARSPLV